MQNIKTGANFVVAQKTETFDNLGFTSVNTAVIYGVLNGTFKSWVPGRSINGITGTVAGQGYMVVSKNDAELGHLLPAPFAPILIEILEISAGGAEIRWNIPAGVSSFQVIRENLTQPGAQNVTTGGSDTASWTGLTAGAYLLKVSVFSGGVVVSGGSEVIINIP